MYIDTAHPVQWVQSCQSLMEIILLVFHFYKCQAEVKVLFIYFLAPIKGKVKMKFCPKGLALTIPLPLAVGPTPHC